MRKLAGMVMMAGLLTLMAEPGWGQRTVGRERDSGRSAGRDGGAPQGTINYNDPSQRRTRNTEREDRQKKEAEEAKRKAEEARRQKEREERMRRWQGERDNRSGNSGAATTANNRQTTGSRAAAGNNAGRRGGQQGRNATAPVTTGGSYDPTTRQVTEVMLDAIKTQHVNFDVEEARKNPSVILLNEPSVDPNDRRRATDTGIARPL